MRLRAEKKPLRSSKSPMVGSPHRPNEQLTNPSRCWTIHRTKNLPRSTSRTTKPPKSPLLSPPPTARCPSFSSSTFLAWLPIKIPTTDGRSGPTGLRAARSAECDRGTSGSVTVSCQRPMVMLASVKIRSGRFATSPHVLGQRSKTEEERQNRRRRRRQNGKDRNMIPSVQLE